ncbi:MAG: ABC transporter permease subunit [bacterium]
MKNIYNLTLLTLREALSRKIFITFFIISSVVLVGFGLVFAFVKIAPPEITVDGQKIVQMNADQIIAQGIKHFINGLLFVGGIFLSIFSVSNFVPRMLDKGTIDLFLSKPLSRQQLIWGKFFGGILVVLLNITYLIFGIWFLMGLKFAIWGFNYLMIIPVITFTFAVLYAMIVLLGIVMRSSILAMMLAYLIFFVLSPLLSARESFYAFINSKFWETVIDGVYYIIPKTAELSKNMEELTIGAGIHDYQPIISSALFMFLNLFLAIIIFNKKDY